MKLVASILRNRSLPDALKGKEEKDPDLTSRQPQPVLAETMPDTAFMR